MAVAHSLKPRSIRQRQVDKRNAYDECACSGYLACVSVCTDVADSPRGSSTAGCCCPVRWPSALVRCRLRPRLSRA